MGLKAIYTTLEKEGISSIDISLAEECIGRNYQLTFQISSEKGILADPISIPQNLPYIFTGKETIPYERIWSDLSKICHPHPLAYIGPKLTQDYTKIFLQKIHELFEEINLIRIYPSFKKWEIP